MRLENTARGWSSAMTSESGSFMSGRSQMKYGRHMVERPTGVGYRQRRTIGSGSQKVEPDKEST